MDRARGRASAGAPARRAPGDAPPRAPQAKFLERVRELGPGMDTWHALAEEFECKEKQVTDHWDNKLKEKFQREAAPPPGAVAARAADGTDLATQVAGRRAAAEAAGAEEEVDRGRGRASAGAPARRAPRDAPRPQAKIIASVRELGSGIDTWRALAQKFECEEKQVKDHWNKKLKEKFQREAAPPPSAVAARAADSADLATQVAVRRAAAAAAGARASAGACDMRAARRDLSARPSRRRSAAATAARRRSRGRRRARRRRRRRPSPRAPRTVPSSRRRSAPTRRRRPPRPPRA